ncbi:unnamed protein product [Clonostachys rosea]|uniref:BZIP domain-containing protein n=1 Tax=Bionectria ochroleuca TaxID=29856 RepID=A0ABY6V165_BIOOC|nr:unnamed protein product [Clonostachys rosea]
MKKHKQSYPERARAAPVINSQALFSPATVINNPPSFPSSAAVINSYRPDLNATRNMAVMGQQSLRIALEALPAHVVELDDWKGVKAREERRRIQNRVNQRAARNRKRASAKDNQLESSQCGLKPSSHPETPKVAINVKMELSPLTPRQEHRDPDFWQMFYWAMKSVPVDRSRLVNFTQNLVFRSEDAHKDSRKFENWMSLLIGSPGRDCLFTLIQFNVFRSMVRNERDLGLPEACALDDDSVSPISDASYVARDMPASLRPTLLQMTVTHHPWIDLLPLPRMRDNLLLADDQYDETALCTAILGCNTNSGGRTGMIVWGEAWDPAGWELTEEFIREWAWTLEGCDEFLASTNYWRQRRGKGALKL